MNKAKSSGSLYVLIIGALILMFGVGTYYFLGEVNQNSILVQSGATPHLKVLNSYKYKQGLSGFIYSGTFLISGLLFFLMVALPSAEAVKEQGVPTPQVNKSMPPQPSRETATQIAQVTEKEVEKIQPANEESKDEELESAASLADKLQLPETKEIIEGEDDVVFGSGAISEEAVIDFVNKYPDSAVKFLFRKNLDGKNLDPDTEDIYKGWEYRGMSRNQVKAYILNVMEWDELPNDPLHETWKKLRDQLFELLL